MYVDANAAAVENGWVSNPFNTVIEGVNAVTTTGVVVIRPGTYPQALSINRAMELRSTGGMVIIGQ